MDFKQVQLSVLVIVEAIESRRPVLQGIPYVLSGVDGRGYANARAVFTALIPGRRGEPVDDDALLSLNRAMVTAKGFSISYPDEVSISVLIPSRCKLGLPGYSSSGFEVGFDADVALFPVLLS